MKIHTFLALFALCLVFPTHAMAKDTGLDAAQKQFSGSYVSKEGVKKERAAIDRVIEELVSEMAFYKRSFARSALKGPTDPCAHVTVTFSADTMAINCKGRPDATSPKDGTVIDWKNDDGSMMRLSQKLEPEDMVQVFRSKSGTRKNVYTLRDGGKTLHIAVTITSEKFPRPLEFTSEMQRE